jgi:nitroreductase
MPSLEKDAFVPEDLPSATGVVADLLSARFSCRGYQPRAVPRETIEVMLRVAQLSASWCNAQPWNVIITEGERTQRFAEALYAHAVATPSSPDFAFPRQYAGPYAERRRETAFRLYDAVGVTRGDRVASSRQTAENFRLFGAPHVAIIHTEADLGIYGAVDCGGYAANLMLAAQSLGVACIAQAALAMHPDFIRDHFGLPPTRRVVMGISFGFADLAHPANGFRTPRADLADVVQFLDR